MYNIDPIMNSPRDITEYTTVGNIMYATLAPANARARARMLCGRLAEIPTTERALGMEETLHQTLGALCAVAKCQNKYAATYLLVCVISLHFYKVSILQKGQHFFDIQH